MTSDIIAAAAGEGGAGLEAEAAVHLTLGPNGPAMAAILAAAIGALAMGIVTTLSEASVRAHDWFDFQQRVGPLSGKTTMAGVTWLVAWAVLHFVFRGRDVPFAAVMALAALLFVAGNVFMLPPVFQRFAAD